MCVLRAAGEGGGGPLLARASLFSTTASLLGQAGGCLASFYMDTAASVIVIAGRDSNHAAVNNRYTAAAEDNVSHIWWVSSATVGQFRRQ